MPDIEAAKAFYGAVLGWSSFVDTGEQFGHYTLCQAGGRNAAAIGMVQSEEEPSAWTVYLASDDADRTLGLIRDNGGTIVHGPLEIPDSGRMAVAQDPQGAHFGVWQGAGMVGTELYLEPGALAWTDVRSSDADAGRAFYAAVAGYRYEPMEMEGAPADYTTIHFDAARDGEAVGGIGGMMGAPEGTPSHWLPYFSVADADAAASAATTGGGTVLGEPLDTPFGRMTTITDPVGATFVVVGPPPSA
ncbi:MAG: VOC family protein [Pseudonocardiales bacterium]